MIPMVHRIWILSTKPRISSITPSAIIVVPPSSLTVYGGYRLGCGTLHSVTLGLTPA